MNYQKYKDVGSRLHYCYRCYTCSGLVTQREIVKAWETERVALCRCGGRRISPSNLLLRDLLSPQVWLQYIDYKRGLTLEPPPE